MFQNLEIRNFRLFEHLKVEKLGRINLFAGGNNSGKTTLLETLFLLCGVGNPDLILRVNTFRLGDISINANFREIFLKSFFYQFNLNQSIEICSKKDSVGLIKLKVTPEPRRIVDLPLQDDRLDMSLVDQKKSMGISPRMFNESTENLWSVDLRLQYTLDESEKIYQSYLRFKDDRIFIDHSHNNLATRGIFISDKHGNPLVDATRLGDLRRRKQGDLLVDALKIMEPRLKTLEENSVAGYPMIWGDIGLAELVPLSMMGEGMTRVARIILAISYATGGGVVMVDEIENGIHYSVLEKVWSVIADAAERARVQVFATTHSFECMAAAHKAIGDKLMVHRIEQDREKKNHCITLEEEGIAAAIRHGFEVR